MAASVLEVLITGDASGLSAALNDASASAKGFEQTADSAANAASSKMGNAFSAIGQTLKTIAPALIAVGAAAVAGIGKGIAATQQWASDTRSLIRITGQTAEGASTLLASSELLGIGVDKLSVGFGALSKNIVNGAPNLAKYGINVRDVNGALLPFDDILGAVSDKFLELPAGLEQAAFASNVFGRSGKELIPILSKGSAGMEELRAKAAELGLVMSQDDLDASKALGAAQRELGLAFKGAAISLGKLFIPALTKVVNVAIQAVEFVTRLPAPVKEIGVGFALAAGAVGTLTVAFSGLKATFGPVIEGITGIGKALFESGLFSNAASAAGTVSTALSAVGTEASAASDQVTSSVDSASEALTGLNAAATAASTAVEAKVVKAGAAVESEGSKLSGFASTAAGALSKIFSPTGLIIAAAVAAIAILTVAIIKNWNTIKAWGASLAQSFGFLRPLFAAVRSAFGELLKASAELRSTFSSAVGELGKAFAPLLDALRPLLPLLEPIGKILATIAIGPLIALLGGLVAVLKVLTAIVQQVSKGVAFFAHLVAFEVTGAINLAIDAINFFINAYNGLASVVSSIPGLELDHVDALEHVSSASNDAATATDAVTAAASDAGPALDSLGNAVDETGRKFGLLGPHIAEVKSLLAAAGLGVKAFRDDAVTAAREAADALASGATEGLDAFQKFADGAVTAAIQARSAFQDSMRSALTFTTSMLSSLEQAAQEATDTLAGDTSDLTGGQLAALREQADITARDILHTFQSATSQTKSFGRDLLELSHIGGQAGKDLAAALATSGDVLSAQVVADAPQKLQGEIVHAFGKSEDAANSFSTKLTNAIVGPLNGILTLLHRIADHFQVDVELNDHGAARQAEGLGRQLSNMAAHNYNVNVVVHTKGGSPMPDEALRIHLIDPMTRMGFHKVSGRWTLPLDIRPHLVTGGMLDHLNGGSVDPPAWYDAATKPIDVPFTGGRDHRRHDRRPAVVLDRRHFVDDLELESDYRGWD